MTAEQESELPVLTTYKGDSCACWHDTNLYLLEDIDGQMWAKKGGGQWYPILESPSEAYRLMEHLENIE